MEDGRQNRRVPIRCHQFLCSMPPGSDPDARHPSVFYRPSSGWWRRADSNRRPLACKASALPTELRPQKPRSKTHKLALPGFRLLVSGFCEKGCADGGAVKAGCKSQTPTPSGTLASVLRKEVIQPQVPLRLPCYDFTPVADLTVDGCLLAVSAPASGKTNSHGVTGGVYKARERIHRGMLIRDY